VTGPALVVVVKGSLWIMPVFRPGFLLTAAYLYIWP
ncbi:unnamed protein product, partial [marine sediment metagenome]